MTTVGQYYDKATPDNDLHKYIKVDPDQSLPFSATLIGIEVECERVGHCANGLDGNGFYVKEDHSLRNNGREVTTYPILSSYAVPAFKKIIDNLGPDQEFNKRTSIHVHFDCTQLSLQQVNNIVYTYILFEEALFGFCDKARRRSIFCVPINTYLGPLTKTNAMVDSWGKYSALNLLTLKQFGTIEFRHLEGTGDIERFRTWFYLIHAIYSYGKSAGEDLLDRICQLNTNSNYYEFANDVFGKLMDNIKPDLMKHMITGIRCLKTTKQKTRAFDIAYNGFILKPDADRKQSMLKELEAQAKKEQELGLKEKIVKKFKVKEDFDGILTADDEDQQ